MALAPDHGADRCGVGAQLNELSYVTYPACAS